MSDLIISVSGLRGVVGQSLTPQVAARYCQAFLRQLKPGPIVLSRDGRATGPMIHDIVRGYLAALGRDVIDAGVASTPTHGVLVRHFEAAGGMQISASHNPPEYNGIKLFGPDGQVLSAADGQQVVQAFEMDVYPWSLYDQVGQVKPCDDTLTTHANLILATVDAAAIRQRSYRVLLDANHGAGSLLGRYLLEQLGCEVTVAGEQPDGKFDHPPEPTAENLRQVGALVQQAGAVVGFCQDPDADRLAIIDERGRYIGEEYTLALCLRHVLSKNVGPVVTNCATSLMSRDLAVRAGAPFHLAPVGEANVVAKMREVSAVFGGEGNGGPIDPRVGYVRDSFVGMALLLDAMAAADASVSQLVAELPHYEIVKTKVPLAKDKIGAAFTALQTYYTDAEVNRMDGIRLEWPDRWLLVRASNTEPIVRLIVEADSSEAAHTLADEASQVLGA